MSSSLTFRWPVLLGALLVLGVLMLFYPLPYSDLLGELVPTGGPVASNGARLTWL